LLSGVDLTITDLSDKSKSKLTEVSNGKYFTDLKCDNKFEILGNIDGYFAQSKQIETVCKTKNDTVFVELVFEPVVIYKPIAIRIIYYDFAKWNIRADARPELDKIVKILKDNPEITIELGSHTDSRGTHAYNEVLSQRRAESAVNYIITQGIDKSRISAKGYGERVLLNECADEVFCSETKHQFNRRTEFKVTGYSKQQPEILSDL
jgi:peptidoglycan-associated lipoprotein